jgi:hypothetical protein
VARSMEGDFSHTCNEAGLMRRAASHGPMTAAHSGKFSRTDFRKTGFAAAGTRARAKRVRREMNAPVGVLPAHGSFGMTNANHTTSSVADQIRHPGQQVAYGNCTQTRQYNQWMHQTVCQQHCF